MKKYLTPTRIVALIALCLLAIVVTRCLPGERGLAGVYVIQNHSHTSDTLWLEPNNKYRRVLRNISDNSIILTESDTWEFEGGKLVLKNYSVDSDRIGVNYSAGGYDYAHLEVSRKGGEYKIYVNIDLGYYYLRIN